MEIYDPKTYWEHRSRTRGYEKYTIVRPTEDKLISKVINNYNIKSLVEIGVGTGRFFPIYKRYNLEVIGCDISEKFIEIANNLGFNYQLILYSKTTIPIEDSKSDIVLSSEMLLHVPEKDIEEVFKEHIRISKKYILIIVSHNAEGKKLPFSNVTDFDHNYEELIKKYNLKILEKGFMDKTIYYFLLEKNA